MSQDPSDDRLLEEFLARRGGIARNYRNASVEQPPADVDKAVLAAARRAAGSRPRRIGWGSRWGAPLAAAAVIVLAVAVTLTLEREPRFAQIEEPLELARPTQRQQEAKSAAPADQEAAAVPARTGAAKEKAVAESGAVPPRAPGIKTDELDADFRQRPQERGRIDFEPEIRRDSVVTEHAPRLPAAAAPDMKQRETLSLEDKAQPAEVIDSPAPAAVLGQSTTAGARANEASEAKSELAAGGVHGKKSALSRDEWIAKIERLFDAGRLDEAKTALAEFRKTYPHAELPEKLSVLEPRK